MQRLISTTASITLCLTAADIIKLLTEHFASWVQAGRYAAITCQNFLLIAPGHRELLQEYRFDLS
jgi:hypothetical protein